MASNGIDDEKPNLRPTKFFDANGKTLGTCHCFCQSWGGSFICATLTTPIKIRERVILDKPGLLGIEEAYVEYSFHKQKRWELLDDIQESLTYSSDDESFTESDFKRQRSYSTSTVPQETYHIKIDSYFSERFRRQPRKPLSIRLIAETSKSEGQTENFYTCIENDDSQAAPVADGITYFIDVSTRRKKIPSIRTNHGKNNKAGRYRSYKKFHLKKEPSYDDSEELSTNDDEFLNSVCSTKVNPLQLNDFLPVTAEKFESKSRQKHRNNRDTNQLSHSEDRKKKIYYEYSTTDVHKVCLHHVLKRTAQLTPKISRHFMSLSFRSVALEKTEFTQEYLSEIYGKKFIQAQCSPITYLIYLTDQLKSFSWLNSYLILILNEDTKTDEKIYYGKVAVNINLNVEMFELKSLLAADEKVYRVEELIEKAIELLATLPVEVFKSIDTEMGQRKLAKDETDRQLSDIEFLNKQIQQVQLLNNNRVQTKSGDSIGPKPNICTICCQDVKDMTALKTCGHWVCNNYWKQYLENSIEHVKLIVCPEWNCTSVVDAGTILSLVNVRCLNIYERHIEKCLLNLSRSYVRCPLTSCSNIISINDSSTSDSIRCRCGYQFCLDCKQEAHFPATCLSYRVYINIAKRNGHLSTNFKPTTTVIGRQCISCNNFIEKNGGCNHMTCRCGAQFCWICASYWNEHFMSSGVWRCPRGSVNLQERIIVGDTNPSRHLYASAIYHRQQRTFQVQSKLKENAKRLIATILMDKDALSDSKTNKTEINERQDLLEHCYQMVEYIKHLHQICEFTCVSAQGYCKQPKEFSYSFQQFELIIVNFLRIFENGRGYEAIEQLNQLYHRSETLIQRLRRAVRLRRMNRSGYITS